MDLESGRSVEENELVETDGLEKNGETDTKTKDNGNCDAENVDSKFIDDIKVEGTTGKTGLLPGGSSPSSAATKGRGLRKWRRIRREAGKETNSSLDSNRKRGMPALPVGMKQRSEGSNSSTNAMSNALGNALDHSLSYGDLGLGRGPDFASREDSDNSRSSTAASAPRMNHVLPVVGLGHDTNTIKSLSGKNSVNSAQPSDQQEKKRNVTKKARGIQIKKENSHSSMESDSRSSNFVFMQGTSSMTSNGRQSGRSANYDEDYSDDAQNGDRHLHEEDQTAFSKNEAGSEDISHEDLAAENSWEVNEEKVDNHVESGDRDALVESIMPLHLAQEALEREVQKLRDVGKEDPLSSDDWVQPSGSSCVDPQSNEPRSFVDFQSIKLEEARVMLELKDAKIFELESTLNFGTLKTEHEELMKQRFAAELEYLVISKTIQNLKVDLTDRTVKQNIKAAESSEQVNLEDDPWELQKRVCRYASCFTIQSVLLLVFVYLFVLRFSAQTVEVIPT